MKKEREKKGYLDWEFIYMNWRFYAGLLYRCVSKMTSTSQKWLDETGVLMLSAKEPEEKRPYKTIINILLTPVNNL